MEFETKVTLLKELAFGDVFALPKNNDYFMKVRGDRYTAIRLNDGVLLDFPQCSEVKPLKATLIVKE